MEWSWVLLALLLVSVGAWAHSGVDSCFCAPFGCVCVCVHIIQNVHERVRTGYMENTALCARVQYITTALELHTARMARARSRLCTRRLGGSGWVLSVSGKRKRASAVGMHTAAAMAMKRAAGPGIGMRVAGAGGFSKRLRGGVWRSVGDVCRGCLVMAAAAAAVRGRCACRLR